MDRGSRYGYSITLDTHEDIEKHHTPIIKIRHGTCNVRLYYRILHQIVGIVDVIEDAAHPASGDDSTISARSPTTPSSTEAESMRSSFSRGGTRSVFKNTRRQSPDERRAKQTRTAENDKFRAARYINLPAVDNDAGSFVVVELNGTNELG